MNHYRSSWYVNNSKEILKDAHKMSRKLNQRVQRNLGKQKYDGLIQAVEKFIKNYPLCSVAQKAVTIVKRLYHTVMVNYYVISCSKVRNCRWRHVIIMPLLHLIILPHIKLNIKIHKQITGSLLNGSPVYWIDLSLLHVGKYTEDLEWVNTNHLIKIQEVAPNVVHKKASKQ